MPVKSRPYPHSQLQIGKVSEIHDSSVVSPEAYVLFYELDGSTFSRL
ncbi:ubiquitin carboxyl-terminal hydrolase 2-like [Tropilaelaps mercedesae]|uniref:Ubiquitin carboxyl-terminal hydrolase 2-like n=1 Tax=Tropilaelaps mercedesae TaxID=418985 RepID=A0A1V9X3K6_9ACAR|nr:ubiquitin carboxyl-terminal hydrolase 2-like [Tropilaelaps mercedesae]